MSQTAARKVEIPTLQALALSIALPWAALCSKYKGCGRLFTIAGVAFHTDTTYGMKISPPTITPLPPSTPPTKATSYHQC
jgi:hypothetical protein